MDVNYLHYARLERNSPQAGRHMRIEEGITVSLESWILTEDWSLVLTAFLSHGDGNP
jgi:hypothetical protein